jgi:clan AA aspartic protease (TIGR02281 family)
MKKNLFLLLLVAISSIATAQDKKTNRPTYYNYLRGVESVQKENTEEALEFFNKDIEENPKNGYSFSWIAMLRLHKKEYGKALTAVNMAIKYLPKKDPEYVIFAYSTRADVYLNLEDTVKALADYDMAIKVKSDESSLYEKRAQIYYEQEKYALADADYHKMIDLNPGGTMGYMGLGRNANAQKRWDDAIKQFDYVAKLSSDYSSAYSFRAESYIGKEKWPEATDDLVKALGLEWDRKALHLAGKLKEPAFTMMVSKMKVQMAKSPNEASWPYIIGTMYEQSKKYEKAIEYYDLANKRDESPTIHERISVCQYELGEYDLALLSIKKAINIDSTDISYLARKANIYYEMGDVKSAIAEWDNVLANQPEYAFGYYRRGWFKELAGDMDGAIEDLSMSIVLDPEYSYAYVSRGDVYLKQGKTDLADQDFKKVIELENTPEKYDCIHYAYQGLGLNDKAIAAMDSIIAREEDRAGSYYDAACLYSRMKDKNNALRCLEKSLELGYMRFAHIERDFDMDFLREMPEFKRLLEKFKSKHEANRNQQTSSASAKETVTMEIPFTKEDGVCKVKCKINELPLHFIFDTGASDVSISMVEASFMMKNGYLNGKDVVGSEHYIDANGDISVGTVINLKNVNFGGMNLNNVRASVVRNQKAPLLLGQSVLARLGKIEIDNAKKVIKITK